MQKTEKSSCGLVFIACWHGFAALAWLLISIMLHLTSGWPRIHSLAVASAVYLTVASAVCCYGLSLRRHWGRRSTLILKRQLVGVSILITTGCVILIIRFLSKHNSGQFAGLVLIYYYSALACAVPVGSVSMFVVWFLPRCGLDEITSKKNALKIPFQFGLSSLLSVIAIVAPILVILMYPGVNGSEMLVSLCLLFGLQVYQARVTLIGGSYAAIFSLLLLPVSDLVEMEGAVFFFLGATVGASLHALRLGDARKGRLCVSAEHSLMLTVCQFK